MGMELRALMMVCLIMGLISTALAVAGTATFYTEYTPSVCYGNQDKGVMIAAASQSIWNGGEACGRMYRIRCTGSTDQGIPQPCTGKSVTVQIVDYCPPDSCHATIDLSQQAFARIANTDAGKIKIDYTQV